MSDSAIKPGELEALQLRYDGTKWVAGAISAWVYETNEMGDGKVMYFDSIGAILELMNDPRQVAGEAEIIIGQPGDTARQLYNIPDDCQWFVEIYNDWRE